MPIFLGRTPNLAAASEVEQDQNYLGCYTCRHELVQFSASGTELQIKKALVQILPLFSGYCCWKQVAGLAGLSQQETLTISPPVGS